MSAAPTIRTFTRYGHRYEVVNDGPWWTLYSGPGSSLYHGDAEGLAAFLVEHGWAQQP